MLLQQLLQHPLLLLQLLLLLQQNRAHCSLKGTLLTYIPWLSFLSCLGAFLFLFMLAQHLEKLDQAHKLSMKQH